MSKDHAAPEPVIEYYYSFDCMNAFLADKLFKADTFEGDQDAIKTAANYEATLYKHRFVNGEKTLSEKLYDPWDCFEEG